MDDRTRHRYYCAKIERNEEDKRKKKMGYVQLVECCSVCFNLPNMDKIILIEGAVSSASSNFAANSIVD